MKAKIISRIIALFLVSIYSVTFNVVQASAANEVIVWQIGDVEATQLDHPRDEFDGTNPPSPNTVVDYYVGDPYNAFPYAIAQPDSWFHVYKINIHTTDIQVGDIFTFLWSPGKTALENLIISVDEIDIGQVWDQGHTDNNWWRGYPEIEHSFTIPDVLTSSNEHIITIEHGQSGDGGHWDWLILKRLTITVSVDIKPGSYPSSINLRKKGVTPVAIHTTDDFDATTVNPLSVRLNDCGPPVDWEAYDCDEFSNPLYGILPDEPEMMGDGDIDLVLYFDTPALAEDECLKVGDTEAMLTGETFEGVPVEGTGDIRIVKGPKP